MIGARILNKRRIVEFDVFETDSISANWIVPYIGRTPYPASMIAKLELWKDGVMVNSMLLNSDTLTPTIDLSGISGTKKIIFKLLKSSIYNGQFFDEYNGANFNSIEIDDRYNYFRRISISWNGGDNNISILPESLSKVEVLLIAGSNTITDLPMMPNIKYIAISGQNTIANVSHFVDVEYLNVDGMNVINDISGMPFLKGLAIKGYNVISGDLANTIGILNDATYFVIEGYNTISSLPLMPNLQQLVIRGNNTISVLPIFPNLQWLDIQGNNTISVLPSMPNLQQLSIDGYNTISDISHLTNLNTINIGGENQLSGTLDSIIPHISSVTSLNLYNSYIQYSGNISFNVNIARLVIDPHPDCDLATDGNAVANIIIDFDNSVDDSVFGRVLSLSSTCAVATPSEALTVALDSLELKGVWVIRNL